MAIGVRGSECALSVPSPGTGGGGTGSVPEIATPSNLANSWSGCVVLIDDDGDGDGFGSSPPSSCNTNYPSLGVNIEPQGLSLGLDWFRLKQLCERTPMDNKELVGGGVGGLVLLLSLILVLRRRSRSYDEEWEEASITSGHLSSRERITHQRIPR